MKKIISVLICTIFVLSVAFTASAYEHDPMDNPKAAKDIVVNPDAVYGYSPSPESERLKDFVDYDWSDQAVVDEMKAQREAYHESIQELYDMISSMKAAGNTAEEIARAVSTRRNEIRLESYKDDPEGLEKVKQSNLDTYGNENGGTPDYFYEKYGSWERVIESSLSANPGADACLGLYDKYYDTYFLGEELGAPDTYTVVSGDSLMSIAERLFGDREMWESLYTWNQDQIKDPNLIYPGQVLSINAQ